MSTNLPGPYEPMHPDAAAEAAPPASPVLAGAGELEGEDGGMDWQRWLSAFRRYKWLMLLVVVLGTAGGVVLARFTPPEYLAQATLWIETSERGDAQRGPIQSGQLLNSYAWVNLLQSYVVLDHVVREQRLYLKEPDAAQEAMAGFGLKQRFAPGEYTLTVAEDGSRFTLATGVGAVVQRGAVGDSIGAELGFEWAPSSARLSPGQVVEFTVAVPRDVARGLRDRLQTQMDQAGKFLRLELLGSDPEQIAAILNTTTERFVEVATELKRAKLDELTKILDNQLEYAAEELRAAEIALEDFRVNTITLPSEQATPIAPGLDVTRDPVFANFFQMKIESEQLRRDRAAIRRVLERPPGSELSVESLQRIPSVQQSPELMLALDDLTRARAEMRALLYRYTPEHPPVERLAGRIDELQNRTIPRLAADVLQAIGARGDALAGRIASASGELQEIPTRAIEEARLERGVAIAENLYTTLQQRYEAARLAAVSSIPDVRVLDEATVPQSPVSNTDPRLILMALAGSLGLALLGAVLLDRADPRLRYPEQVTQGLGLPILGAVSHVEQVDEGGGATANAQVVEALRTIRLGLVHAHGTAGPLVVTVSSPGVGDGKSFISSNLAVAFADQGHRTLLIDGDIRRGTLHRLFDSPRKPGLTNLLTGEASRDEVVRRTGYPLLDVIGCGSRMQSGPELLGTPEMRQVLVDARSDYEVILVDSPPLGAAVDPFILSTLTGNLLLVLRTGSTNRDMAESKLDVLDRMPVRILGAILNDIPDSGGPYRYYSYLAGYEAADEDAADDPKVLQKA